MLWPNSEPLTDTNVGKLNARSRASKRSVGTLWGRSQMVHFLHSVFTRLLFARCVGRVCVYTFWFLLLVSSAIARYLSRTDSRSGYDLLNVWDLSNANARKRLNVAELTVHLGGGRQERGREGLRD